MPLPVPTHTLFIAKQPALKLNPTFDVEVAEPEILKPERVVVPKPAAETRTAVEDALFTISKRFTSLAPPQIVVRAYGVVVPIPTNPVDFTIVRSSVFAVKFPVNVNSVDAPSKAMAVSAKDTPVELKSSVVPASKVSVPEVYESEASERRKLPPSIPSSVPVQSPVAFKVSAPPVF